MYRPLSVIACLIPLFTPLKAQDCLKTTACDSLIKRVFYIRALIPHDNVKSLYNCGLIYVSTLDANSALHFYLNSTVNYRTLAKSHDCELSYMPIWQCSKIYVKGAWLLMTGCPQNTSDMSSMLASTEETFNEEHTRTILQIMLKESQYEREVNVSDFIFAISSVEEQSKGPVEGKNRIPWMAQFICGLCGLLLFLYLFNLFFTFLHRCCFSNVRQ